MDHFQRIYSARAVDYHPLIAAEDVDGNLPKALHHLTAFTGKRVLDLGTGTGRLPMLLGHEAAQIVGVDLHWDMLRQNSIERGRAGGRWVLLQSDMRRLPCLSRSFDVVTAGWAIGHLRGWHTDDWQTQIGAVLSEMQRVVRPGGALIIMETLSTGSLTPAPPTAGLAEYYAWLEAEWGFAREAIRTDYQFPSVDEAVAHTEFFFGSELSAKIRANGWARLPEWTGVWHTRVA